MDKAIEHATSGCHQCVSLRKILNTIVTQSTEDPPDGVGVSFAADVMKREKQLVLIVRECVTSYTMTCFISNETCAELRDALISMCIQLRPMDGPPATIRTDPAPGFSALVNDEGMQHHRLSVEIGRIKNRNKNPVAEKAVQELEEEILRLIGSHPADQFLTSKRLAVATASLNARIRTRGLSAREMLSQRDQFTNQQIPVTDRDLIVEQHKLRVSNHAHSEVSKAPRGSLPAEESVDVGDIVYVYSDRNKSRGRNRYLVVATNNPWCSIRKFTGNQLRSMSYRVKKSECYKVPSTWIRTAPDITQGGEDSDNEEVSSMPPAPPVIPAVLTTPEETTVSRHESRIIPADLATHEDTTDVGSAHELHPDPISNPVLDSFPAEVHPVGQSDVPMDSAVEDQVDSVPQSGTAKHSRRSRKVPAWHNEYVMDK
jgi:hypothetical protein